MPKASTQWNYQVRELSDGLVPVIECRVENSGTHASFRFTLSYHAADRCMERGISVETLALALLYARPFCKQGVIFHVVSLRMTPENLPWKQKKHLQDLVVITNRSASCIITAYYCPQAFRKTSKKVKFNCKVPRIKNSVGLYEDYHPHFRGW